MIFSTVRAPQEPRLDGRVVGHDGDPPASDCAQPDHNAVGGKILGQDVGEEPVLDERPQVEEEVEPLADGELVLLAQLGQVPGAASQRLLAELPRPLGHAAAQGSRPAL